MLFAAIKFEKKYSELNTMKARSKLASIAMGKALQPVHEHYYQPVMVGNIAQPNNATHV